MENTEQDWLDNPFAWWRNNDRPTLGEFYVGLGYKMNLMGVLDEVAYQLSKIDQEQARMAESGVYLVAAALVGKHLDESDRLAIELMTQVVENQADDWLEKLVKEEGNGTDS